MVACRMTLLCASLLGASAWMLAAPGAPARHTGASRLPVAPQMNSDGLSAEFQARTAPYGMIRAFPTHWSAPAPWARRGTRAIAALDASLAPCVLPRLGRARPIPNPPLAPTHRAVLPPRSQRLVNQRSGAVFGHPSEILREQRADSSWVLLFNVGEVGWLRGRGRVWVRDSLFNVGEVDSDVRVWVRV